MSSQSVLLNSTFDLTHYNVKQSSCVDYRDRIDSKRHILWYMNIICFLKDDIKIICGRDSGRVRDGSKIHSFCEAVANDNLRSNYPLIFFSDSYALSFMKRNVLNFHMNRCENVSRILTLKKDSYLKAIEQSLELIDRIEMIDMMINTKLEEILLYLLYRSPVEMTSFLKGMSLQFHPFKSIIESEQSFCLTNKELASRCHMSISSLKRKFKTIYDCSPQQYFIDKRMEYAKKLLNEGIPPTAFYNELGYESLSSFSHEFKKRYGYPPRSILNG